MSEPLKPSGTIATTAKKSSALKMTFYILFLLVFSSLSIAFWFYHSNDLKNFAFTYFVLSDTYADLPNRDSVKLKKELSKLKTQTADLQKRIAALTPPEPYLIINTTINNFVLRNRKKVIRQGLCSTGSYTLLHAGDDKQWIFKTPKGMFRIQGKVTNPVWIKPDWAFVEEGLPIPSKSSPDRYEYGSLGDFAMSLGQGYLIHGTLYQRFLGMPVTHGCVRLGDADLEAVYRSLDIGSRVFIY